MPIKAVTRRKAQKTSLEDSAQAEPGKEKSDRGKGPRDFSTVAFSIFCRLLRDRGQCPLPTIPFPVRIFPVTTSCRCHQKCAQVLALARPSLCFCCPSGGRAALAVRSPMRRTRFFTLSLSENPKRFCAFEAATAVVRPNDKTAVSILVVPLAHKAARHAVVIAVAALVQDEK